MSDAVRSSTTNIQALVEEIISQRPGRVEQKRSHHAGLVRATRRSKYAGCEYRRLAGGSVRVLTPREVEEFRAAVDAAIEAKR